MYICFNMFGHDSTLAHISITDKVSIFYENNLYPTQGMGDAMRLFPKFQRPR